MRAFEFKNKKGQSSCYGCISVRCLKQKNSISGKILNSDPYAYAHGCH